MALGARKVFGVFEKRNFLRISLNQNPKVACTNQNDSMVVVVEGVRVPLTVDG